jgi:uncharacterized protein (DUF433 family)
MCFTSITIDSRVHFGKPCVTGTRIMVQNVLDLVEEGIPYDKIVKDYYPDLSPEDINACMRYAISFQD